jgi:formiminotetrahydrofolate cyclodeaminase
MPENKLLGLSVAEFLDRLAADAPTPGGGSVAALVGALAAGLGQMSCNFTLGREKFQAVEPQVQAIAERLGRASSMMRRLIEEDAAAYAELSSAFKLPKDDPQRPQRIQVGASVAAGVPFQIVALSRQIVGDLQSLRSLANPRLVSDVDAGIHLATAAIPAAAANVEVNLPYLAEADANRLRSELEHMLAATARS